MDVTNDAEPTPLVPARSERLCVQSSCAPWEAPRLLHSSTCFGPSKRCLSRAVPLPSPRVRDFSPPPPTEHSVSVATRAAGSDDEGEVVAAAAGHPLHQAVWLADWPRARELLDAAADVNAADSHGATPLTLAVQLLPRAPGEYTAVVRQLLDATADPRLRSRQGWSPLDEAVSRGDEALVRMLFEGTQRRLGERWDKRLTLISTSLGMLPDFECRIRWEFESPVLPLINKLAPSDVVRLRKQGASLRIDSTLASWKRFRLSKRRDLTTLFQGGSLDGGLHGADPSSSSLCMLNHTKRTVVDVTEGLDTNEAGAVLGDLVSADVMQWDMQLDDLEVTEATTWLGASAGPCEVNGWKAMRFDVRGTLGVSIRRKGRRRQGMTFEEYFGCSLPPDVCLPELREEFRGDCTPSRLLREESRTTDFSAETLVYEGTFDLFEGRTAAGGGAPLEADELSSNASEVIARWPGASTPVSGTPYAGSPRPADNESSASSGGQARPRHRRGQRGADQARSGGRGKRGAEPAETGDRAGKTTHRVSASVWLATDFPISLQQFLPILEALSVEHEAMRRLKELLSSQSLRTAAEHTRKAACSVGGGPGGGGHVFPVRAAVPLNIAVRALVHFEAFEFRPPGSLPAELFKIPADYTWVSRGEAQKTSKRAKKRMLLANLAL
uniref:Ankyrin repeat domain-containing protein n=1 Tax=Pyrodinium bahamense TaxID=73915 RepID=A0A7S0AS73_9DINO|mmetsp:Transcript_40854/g.113596  ORF Transcript_40854/g.113596 Transcript_40854/m.113596 type:complete len:669 (+) Transcript_40854:83-2089(+)